MSFQTDAARPAALPTAKISTRTYDDEPAPTISSEEYLDNIEEEWNKKVDAEVETLVDGMVDLVGIASIGNKDKYQVAMESFQTQCRTESMVRAASSLMSITHSLKLMLLLSDESLIVQRHNVEIRTTSEEAEKYRKEVAEVLDELLHGSSFSSSSGTSSSHGQTQDQDEDA